MKTKQEIEQPIILPAGQMAILQAEEAKVAESQEKNVLLEKIAEIFFNQELTPEEKILEIKAITPPDNDVKAFLIFLRKIREADAQASQTKGIKP